MIKPFIYKGVCCIMKENDNDNDNRFINNVNIDYELLHCSSTLTLFYVRVTEVLDYEEETLAYYAKGYRKRKYIDP